MSIAMLFILVVTVLNKYIIFYLNSLSLNGYYYLLKIYKYLRKKKKLFPNLFKSLTEI